MNQQAAARNVKAQQTVWCKGWVAGSDGRPASDNPYQYQHEGARSTFRGVWHKRWQEGWTAATDVRRVLRWLWLGGNMPVPDQQVAATLTELDGTTHRIEAATIADLLRQGLLRKSKGTGHGVLTDLGRRLIEVPTQAQLRSVEVSGPDVRKGSRSK